MSHSITSQDHFLLIASDGLFDELSNTQIVQTLSTYLQSASTENAASHVIQAALSNDGGAKKMTTLLSMEPPMSRSYRDDMTVQVVFFNTPATQHLSDSHAAHVPVS